MGTAIYNHKGTIDKYMGDGIMAIFGLEGDEHPAILAYNAATEMLDKLKNFNKYLGETYGESFQIGIGIHYGPVVVGQLGHPKQSSFTTIGDTVNVAARIESATKGRGNILVSKPVYEAIGESNWEFTELLLKGKTETLSLYISPV
jgi:adenylate cyclase